MPMIEDLLRKARRVSRKTKIDLGPLGRKIMDDSKFFPRLAAGGDVTTRNYERVSRELDRLERAHDSKKEKAA